MKALITSTVTFAEISPAMNALIADTASSAVTVLSPLSVLEVNSVGTSWLPTVTVSVSVPGVVVATTSTELSPSILVVLTE
jgi:hypothetical protein